MTTMTTSAKTTKTTKTAPKSDVRQEIDQLLNKLRAAKTIDEKKAIRRALRARGHRGGLGLRAPRKAQRKAPRKAARKGSARKASRKGTTAPAQEAPAQG